MGDREVKGEITLLIGRGQAPAEHPVEKDIAQYLQAIMREQHLDEEASLKVLAKECGPAKSGVYRELQRTKHRERLCLIRR